MIVIVIRKEKEKEKAMAVWRLRLKSGVRPFSISCRFHRRQFLRESVFFHLRAGDQDHGEYYNRTSRKNETVDALVQN